jgi:hypothetical protein
MKICLCEILNYVKIIRFITLWPLCPEILNLCSKLCLKGREVKVVREMGLRQSSKFEVI